MSVLLLRHGVAAGLPPAGQGDLARPLTAAGRAQADALGDHLGVFAVRRIVCSPALRCQQTVAPLAAARHLDVEVDDALGEHAPLDAVVALVRRAVPDDGDLLVCTHGPVVGSLLRAAEDAGATLPAEVTWPTASTWVLDRWPDPTAARHLAPPT